VALKHAAEEGVYMLKPNLGELSYLAGKKEIPPDEIKNTAQKMIAGGACEVMAVSMGAAGAMLVTAEMATTYTPPAVERKSTVGAGDSMVAGIVFYLAQKKNLLQAVQYGVACGTAATLNAGTELCKKEDADRLFTLIQQHS
jgi:6-phosphofructokinase 2